MQPALIALQREHVVSYFIENFLRYFTLASRGVHGDDGGEDVSELIIRRRTVPKGQETVQKFQSLLAEKGYRHPVIGPRQHGAERQKQDFLRRISRPLELARIFKFFYMIKKTICWPAPSENSAMAAMLLCANQKITYGFSANPICHLNFHAIALPKCRRSAPNR